MKKLLLTLSALLVLAFGGDFEDANKAYEEGNDKKAFELYQKAADQGNIIALDKLGNFYCFGNVVERDDKKAVELYQKAAEKGYAPAQYHLAIMYKVGQGVKQDYSKAIDLLKKSAKQGHQPARRNLARWCQSEPSVCKQ